MKRWESVLYWFLIAVALAAFACSVWLAFHADGLLTDLP